MELVRGAAPPIPLDSRWTLFVSHLPDHLFVHVFSIFAGGPGFKPLAGKRATQGTRLPGAVTGSRLTEAVRVRNPHSCNSVCPIDRMNQARNIMILELLIHYLGQTLYAGRVCTVALQTRS